MENLNKEEQKEKQKITDEVREKVSGYILTALGLVAGLAWNDAIKSLIESLFPKNSNSITVKFIYALLITTVVVVVSTYLVKIIKKNRE